MNESCAYVKPSIDPFLWTNAGPSTKRYKDLSRINFNDFFMNYLSLIFKLWVLHLACNKRRGYILFSAAYILCKCHVSVCMFSYELT